MADLRIPPPTRIAIGTATLGGQSVDLFLNPEWARYFESLNSQVVVTSNAVGLPGAPGTTGAAGFGMCMDGEGGGSDEFMPGPMGPQGPQGSAGPALFLLQDDARSDDIPGQPTQLAESFVTPALLNSWVNYDASTYNAAAYYKDQRGIVHLRGLVASGTVGLAIFSLPAGYRPARVETFAVNSNSAFGRVDANSNGDVILNVGSNIFVSLDGISFRAVGTY